MIAIAGYTIIEQLYESANSQVYRARRNDDVPVILKILTEEYPAPEKVAWFRREYEITSRLRLPGVVQAYDFQTNQHRSMIVLEDFGGRSLKQLNLAGALDMPRLLRLAIAITDILGHIHQHHLIHKDINPANIVLNPETQQVKLIDFGIATLLSRENPTFRNPNVIEGTLAYIAPEQTGRMNRAIDERSDFYSFGVTLYELLTGSLPFGSDDPLELVHSHIARQPDSPYQRYVEHHPDTTTSPLVLQALSAVILKLMAKNAEGRYQSAYGLKADLEQIAQHALDTPADRASVGAGLASFAPGQHDLADRLFLPQKLYGREAELQMLHGAFAQVSRGQGQLVLVSGGPGIGKSALVQELYKPITHQRGYFISGKFDQFQRAIPYSALIQAFRLLIRHLLTESAAHITDWCEQLHAALEPNGQIIVDIIPDIALIIGPQPPLPDLGPAEAQNRFNHTLQRFIQVFTRPEHPLVLVIDDMQWADSASLNLLQRLLTLSGTDDQHNALLVIGTYRDTEVTSGHPLLLMLQALRDSAVVVNEVRLAPLDAAAVQHALAETLHTTTEQVRELADMLIAKTDGNPFFLAEFLKSLYADALLWFDQAQGCWQWNIADMQSRQITDNVAELMTARLQQLPDPTRELLQLAACLGHQCDLATLAAVAGHSAAHTARQLNPALETGVLLPLSDSYKLTTLDMPEVVDLVDVTYAFAHDHIHQAVYALIPPAEREALHWHIGTLLWQRQHQAGQVEEHIFDIVSHLNQGAALLDTRPPAAAAPSRATLAELNLLAGHKARASVAYDAAFTYLQTSMQLLHTDSATPDPWHSRYQFTLQVYEATAEVAYLHGDFETMERLVTVVLERAHTVLDCVTTYETRIIAAVARQRLAEAVQTALHALSLLGLSLPAEPDPADFMHGLEQVTAALDGRPVTALYHMPAMTDPPTLAAMRLLTSVMSAAYLTSPTLSALITFAEVQLSLTHGHAPMSPFAYGMYGFILCGILGDIDTGYQFGELALNLAEHPDARTFKASTMHVVNAGVRHWKAHVADTVPAFLSAYQSGMEVGDIQYAANAAYMHIVASFIAGKNLRELAQEKASFRQRIAQLNQEAALTYHELYRQVILNLLGESDDPLLLVGEAYDETVMLPQHQQAGDQTGLHLTFCHKLLLCYLFHDYAQAVHYADQAEQTVAGVTSSPQVPFFYFYDSLARLALLRTAPPPDPDTQHALLDKVAANQEKMQQWAHHAPMNHQHRWHLVEAERAHVAGQQSQAWEHYRQARHLAQHHGYRNDEALACELTALFFQATDEADVATIYLRKAHYAFTCWGATARVHDMEQRYAHLFKPTPSGPTTTGHTTVQLTTEHTPSWQRSTDQNARILDFASVIKASQTIAGEIVLDTLLSRLMETLIENAGAERGVLLLDRVGQWLIEAEGSIHHDTRVLQSTPLSESATIPRSVVNYVMHTCESVVLNDAVESIQFGQDTYITTHYPRSVLCTPLLYQGKMTGLLYLENRQTVGAFTTDRLEVLNLLHGHIAISIENAHLYTEVQSREKKYRTLFEESKDVIFITTLDGTILDINPAGLHLFGLTSEEAFRINARDVYASAQDRQRLLSELQAQGSIRDFEVVLRHKDGTEFDCLLTAALRQPENGMPMHIHGIIRDVTQQKQAERERLQLTAMQRELAIARSIQQSLLPSSRPAWEGLDMVCYTMPAREVGGDLYAYHRFEPVADVGGEPDPTTYALAVGDVSGKGTPAALLMAVSVASFRSFVEQRFCPADFLGRMDKAIATYTHTTGQNCAMVYLELTSSAGPAPSRLRVVNAGCIPPLIKRRDGCVFWVDVGGFPLGSSMANTLGYQEQRLDLSPGDLVILVSDGVVEANNPAGELFGFDRMEQVAARGPTDTAEAMLNHIRAAVDTFVNGREPHDDMTIAVLRM